MTASIKIIKQQIAAKQVEAKRYAKLQQSALEAQEWNTAGMWREMKEQAEAYIAGLEFSLFALGFSKS